MTEGGAVAEAVAVVETGSQWQWRWRQRRRGGDGRRGRGRVAAAVRWPALTVMMGRQSMGAGHRRNRGADLAAVQQRAA